MTIHEDFVNASRTVTSWTGEVPSVQFVVTSQRIFFILLNYRHSYLINRDKKV